MRSKKLIHFPFYCHEYLGIMSELSSKERGFWITLLATYVVSDGVWPDRKRLEKRCDCEIENDKEILLVLMKEIEEIGKSIIEKQKKLSKTRAKSGSKGGVANAKQMLSKIVAKEKQTGKQNTSIPEPEPELEQEQETEQETNTPLYSPPEGTLLLPFFADADFQEVWGKWILVRERKKATNSKRAIDNAIKKLFDLSKGDKVKAIKILNQAIEKGWKSLYPLPQESLTIENDDERNLFEKIWNLATEGDRGKYAGTREAALKEFIKLESKDRADIYRGLLCWNKLESYNYALWKFISEGHFKEALARMLEKDKNDMRQAFYTEFDRHPLKSIGFDKYLLCEEMINDPDFYCDLEEFPTCHIQWMDKKYQDHLKTNRKPISEEIGNKFNSRIIGG